MNIIICRCELEHIHARIRKRHWSYTFYQCWSRWMCALCAKVWVGLWTTVKDRPQFVRPARRLSLSSEWENLASALLLRPLVDSHFTSTDSSGRMQLCGADEPLSVILDDMSPHLSRPPQVLVEMWKGFRFLVYIYVCG